MSTDVGGATELWLLWKRANEVVRADVVGDMTTQTGLSEPDLSVMVQLSDAGGMLRQSAIAARLGWDRTRLSHLLTRMEARGHVARTRVTNGVEITLRPAGQRVVEASLPGLEASARRHILDKLGDDDAKALRRILDRLLSGDA
jgi:DNA-binding MarR family transcriptional regulator